MLKEDFDLYRVLRYTNPIAMIRFLSEFDSVKFSTNVKERPGGQIAACVKCQWGWQR